MTPPETEQLLATAMQHHQSGRLAEAETFYRRVLTADPSHLTGLQYLGILNHQAGRHDAAIDLLGKALALNSQDADTHYNIGAVFQVLGRLDEAAAHYAKATALKSDFAEAYYELGNVLARQDKPGDAAAQYRRAWTLRPNFFEALTNLGSVLLQEGKRDEAVARWHAALALQPDYAVARMNLGIALKQERKLNEALAQLRQAVALQPGYADAHYNLGVVFQGLGQWDEARSAYRRALANQPDLPEALGALIGLLLAEGNIAEALRLARRAFAARETHETRAALTACLCSPLLHPGMGDLRDVLVRALSEPWARPSVLAPTGTRFLALNPSIRDGMSRAAKAWPKLLTAEELAGPSGLMPIAEDRLLRTLLESAPVCEVALERFATGLRFTLLAAAQAEGTVAAPVLDLYCALARQCFINNYVFAQSGAETEQVRTLNGAVAAALASGDVIPALRLVAVAAYVPLHTLPGAASLLDRLWPDAVAALLAQQVRAPIEEQRLRASMPALTAIEDGVSAQVRSQYEENPYPLWVKTPPGDKPKTIGALMRQAFPLSPFAETGRSGSIDVLVAGCGTGQHSIDTASRFKAARTLAVDLSLASLGYAQRQTRALGIDTIEYAQADIMKLPSIGRTFDVIESVGVLHHLSDPLAGWRTLLSMLRPGGVMAVGLYSEIARRDFAAARDLIAQRGYRPTADDIRRFRQDVLDAPDGTPLKSVVALRDFFSISECRDLMFHVQEHRLTLPAIAAFIAENDLEFLGFELDLQTRLSYGRQYPDDPAMTDLAHWQHFETANPRTFIQMYQFWVQKK